VTDGPPSKEASDEPKDVVVTTPAENPLEVAQKRDLQRMLAEVNFISGEVNEHDVAVWRDLVIIKP
jgi:hypothetical protein